MSVGTLLIGLTVLCCCSSLVTAGIEGSVNLTDFIRHRQKRFLIFDNGGSIRLFAGPVMPIDFGDPVPWRNFISTYNIQGAFYDLPSTPVYPWDKWEETFARSMKNVRKLLDRNGNYKQDDSRLFVYLMLESLMHRRGGNGRACLLRSICENAQVDHHVGILAEVLNIVLTPGRETLHPCYKQAHVAGKAGAACLQLYPDCPEGVNLFDQYLGFY